MSLDESRPRLRILVIDDDRFMLEMLPMWLETAFPEWGQPEITTARSPGEGRIALARTCPDVVLSDYDLRDATNGVRLLEHVQEICPSAVRVLFSGHAREEIGMDLNSPSLHGFLEKPMHIQEMLEPFRAIVEQNILAAA